VNQMVAEIAD